MSDTEKPTKEAIRNPNAVEALTARRFRIPGDVVNAATVDLPDDQRSNIRWFHAYCSERDLSLTEAARIIRYDDSTLHRIFNGKYEGSLEKVCREISAWRKLETERSKGRKLQFVETSMSRRIWTLCRAAVEYQRICYIFGATQIGKTEALLRFRDEHNHGSTIYVRMPTGGPLGDFLAALAVALRISPQQKEKELKRRILKSFDDRMLLIVDEAHQCVLTNGTASHPVKSIEFIREIFDASGCGVVICATNVFRTEMETGKLAGVLKQSRRRRLAILQLASTPSDKDLNAFSAAYKLDPATGDAARLQADMIRDEGLGMWLTLLRMAAKISVGKSKPMGWHHVLEAYAGLKELEGTDQ